MMDFNALSKKVEEVKAARERVAAAEMDAEKLESELRAMVGAANALVEVPAQAGKMAVAGAAPKTGKKIGKKVAQKDFPAAGVESLPKRLVRLLVEHPDRTWTPEQAREAVGKDFEGFAPLTFASLLYRAARKPKGDVAKKAPGVFQARAKKVVKAPKVSRRIVKRPSARGAAR